jgi:hypothetical protein
MMRVMSSRRLAAWPARLLAGALALLLLAPSVARAQSIQRDFPPPPPAQPPGQDAVHLKNGGLLRGSLVEMMPGTRVRIQLATGEVATVPWSEVERVETPPTTAAPPLPAPAPPPPPPPPPAPAPPRTVRVHLEGASDAVLESDEGGTWVEVCRAPCDEQLPVGPTYRVAGGVKTSNGFALRETRGGVLTLHVNGASQGAFVGGIVAMPVGYVVGQVGVGLAIVGHTAANATFGVSDPNGGALEATGWTMAVIGVTSIVVGLTLTLSNIKTTTSLRADDPEQPRTRPDSWSRLPTWREPPREAAAAPRAVTFPLFSGDF